MTVLLLLGFYALNVAAVLAAYAFAREWGMRRAIKAGRRDNQQ